MGSLILRLLLVAYIQLDSGRDKSRTLSNFRSQSFESNATPAYVFIVVCWVVGFTGMANPKAALESKASNTEFWQHFIHLIGRIRPSQLFNPPTTLKPSIPASTAWWTRG